MQVITPQKSVYATYNCFPNTCESLVIRKRGKNGPMGQELYFKKVYKHPFSEHNG